MAGSTQKKANAFASSPLSKRSGYLNTPSSDSKSDFAYSGGALERFVFITPAFISIFMITFVTFWGARVSPALTVVFICCYVSYGWVKGIHSALFSLFRYPGCHAHRDVNCMNSQRTQNSRVPSSNAHSVHKALCLKPAGPLCPFSLPQVALNTTA